MKTLKVFDGIFSHNPYSCLNCYSEYLMWDVNPQEVNNGDIVFFTDHSLEKVRDFKDKPITRIAWLLESPAIIDHTVIFQYLDDFDMIFTLRRDFLEASPKFKFLPVWGSWIKYEDRAIYPKNKTLSTIASYKCQTDGHKLRHTIISLFGNAMDIYGSGYNPIDDKLLGLKDYMFSIVIENTKQDYYFSEKLLDCFTTGTIPIYWGCPSIGDFFNPEGILTFNTLKELQSIISELSPDLYGSKLLAIEENFKLANKYKTPEDYLINYSGILD